MFEKETEEYATRLCCTDCKAIICAEKCECWTFAKKGAEFGYNKANEWHFVKDELPDEGTYLVVWQNDKGYKEIFILNYEEEDDEGELHWVDDDCEVQDEYVIAWKEIVLPKEIKND